MSSACSFLPSNHFLSFFFFTHSCISYFLLHVSHPALASILTQGNDVLAAANAAFSSRASFTTATVQHYSPSSRASFIHAQNTLPATAARRASLASSMLIVGGRDLRHSQLQRLAHRFLSQTSHGAPAARRQHILNNRRAEDILSAQEDADPLLIETSRSWLRREPTGEENNFDGANSRLRKQDSTSAQAVAAWVAQRRLQRTQLDGEGNDEGMSGKKKKKKGAWKLSSDNSLSCQQNWANSRCWLRMQPQRHRVAPHPPPPHELPRPAGQLLHRPHPHDCKRNKVAQHPRTLHAGNSEILRRGPIHMRNSYRRTATS